MQVTEAPAPPTLLALSCRDCGGRHQLRTSGRENSRQGIDLAGEAGTWDSTLASTESCWASTFTCDETAAGRQKVTNLRLPGQYDERLLASIGLRGPYYNESRPRTTVERAAQQ